MREIIGGPDLLHQPWSNVCSLVIHTAKQTSLGTGALISSNIVLTAAHNLADAESYKGHSTIGGDAKEILVKPGGAASGIQSVKVSDPERFSAPLEWKAQVEKRMRNEKYETAFDYGVIDIGKGIVPGSFGLAKFDSMDDLKGMTLCLASVGDEQGNLYCQYETYDSTKWKLHGDGKFEHTFFTAGASSGGPIFTESNSAGKRIFGIVGVHNTKMDFKDKPDYNLATRITPNVESWLSRFLNAKS